MSNNALTDRQIQEAISFHGHSCPGLAYGLRVAEYALREFGHSGDEEIVAITETDMCAVDAIQSLVGCSFGKGNLLYHDTGKVAFTFYRRSDGKSRRVVRKPERTTAAGEENKTLMRKKADQGLTEAEAKRLAILREMRMKEIMTADFEDLFSVKESALALPRHARIVDTLVCERCGEPVMETRTRRSGGAVLCIPCFEAEDRRA
ncbi:FmdE family protein [Shumkonia mesophila]|uniref:FmdE family protein n=1 Tax=Shumkonia mesophila TaxID=2838854 RepID=UPI00293506B8|nr:FmdE family protein [Shumkonia mesophila]